MSIALRYDTGGVDAMARRLHALASLDTPGLLEQIGAEVESQTRRRLTEQKSAPDGTPWPAWSPAYAATRHSGQSLLMSDGGLLDSIQYQVEHQRVLIGSNLIYAAHHQFGGEDIGSGVPARRFLGLGTEDRADLQEVVRDFLHDPLRSL